jgi:hypothetical protein
MSLDRGTKIYAGILGAILSIVVIIWLSGLDFRLGEIDDILQQDPEIASYPYKFRALEIQGKTAVISSPRSTSMPAIRFLGIIKPSLANKSDQDPALISAQKELGALQSKVKKLVLSHKGIEEVQWRLDRQWYADRGLAID